MPLVFLMELSTAVNLIKGGVAKTTSQTWADLGAGEGLFSEALSTLLPSGKIIAVDKDHVALKKIHLGNPAIVLELRKSDLVEVEFPGASLDGILMANSIHYVKDKVACVQRLVAALRPGGRIIVVEYDMDTANRYVPYPVSFSSLELIAKWAGLGSCVKLAAAASVYQRAGMYSAMLN
jgi:ubiquinone/menaquinone biosynthesis C-methylase UbiE